MKKRQLPDDPEGWDDCLALFKRIGPTIDELCESANLYPEKYPHDGKAWFLRFKHPKGGCGSLHLNFVDGKTVRLSTSWSYDIYREFARYVKWDSGREIKIEEENIRDSLISDIRKILNWKKEDLEKKGGYENTWKSVPEKEFEARSAENRYQDLKLDSNEN